MQMEDVNFEVEAISDKAILVSDGDGTKAWLPKSQISCYDCELCDLKKGEVYEFSVPEWLLEQHDLEY